MIVYGRSQLRSNQCFIVEKPQSYRHYGRYDEYENSVDGEDDAEDLDGAFQVFRTGKNVGITAPDQQ